MVVEHLCRDEGAPASHAQTYIHIHVWPLTTGPKQLRQTTQLRVPLLPVWHGVLQFQRNVPCSFVYTSNESNSTNQINNDSKKRAFHAVKSAL